MVLYCTEEEKKELIIKKVISLEVENGVLIEILKAKSPITDEIFTIQMLSNETVLPETLIDESDEKIKTTINHSNIDTSNFNINQWWELFLHRVPSNIEHGIWGKNNINTGKRILKSNKEAEYLFKLNADINNISPKSMLLAYAYDLYCYRITSSNENKLKYMLSLDNWLTDTHRIETLTVEAYGDLDFIDFYVKNPIIVEQDAKAFSPFNSLNDNITEYEF